jgi:biofilm PGA synthesis N-glycosyltransferase PgaC
VSFGLNADKKGLKILGFLTFLIPFFVLVSFLLPLYVSVIIVNFVLLYLVVLFLLLFLRYPGEKDPRVAKKAYSLAVLVASFNSKNTIMRCIKSIKAMDYPLPFRIIVADDGSTDGSREMLQKMKGIIVLKLPHRGKGFALNDGLKLIKEEAFVCIDSDTYPPKDTLMKLVGHLDDPKVGAINAMLIPDKKKNFIQRVQFLEYMMGFGFWNTVLSSVNIMAYVTGPLTVFRRSAMEKAGYYFDTKNLAEDMEIGMRLQKSGFKIKVCASVCCETDIPDSLQKLIKQRDRWYRSRVYNLIKHRDLFFNNINPQLGFFGLPYLFMVEILMIVLLIRLGILLIANVFDWLSVSYLLIFVGKVMPPVNMDFAVATQAYFFVAAMAAVAIQYYLGLRFAEYKLKKSDFLPILFEVTIYPYFIALIYLRGMVRELMGAKPVWERVST